MRRWPRQRLNQFSIAHDLYRRRIVDFASECHLEIDGTFGGIHITHNSRCVANRQIVAANGPLAILRNFAIDDGCFDRCFFHCCASSQQPQKYCNRPNFAGPTGITHRDQNLLLA